MIDPKEYLERAKAAKVAIRKAAREIAPELPSGVDWRPIDGFPGYAIARDRSVWSCWKRGGIPGPWARLAWVMRGRNRTCPTIIIVDADGVKRFRPVARLYREAFVTPRLPEGDPGLEEIEDVDDLAEDERLGMPEVPRLPTPRRAAKATPPAEIRTPIPTPKPSAPPSRPAVEMPEGGPHARGSDASKAKLDEAKVIELRRLFESVGVPSLARRYGISETSVYNAAAGKTWGHVPGAIVIHTNPKRIDSFQQDGFDS